MKSFAAVAIMALSACAVDIEAEQYITKQTAFKAPDTGVHTHDQPVVHVNVWQTVNDEIAELTEQITALQLEVNEQMENVTMSSSSFDMFLQNVQTLKDTNTMNSSDLATQKAIDAAQETKLEQLVTDITALEHKVSDLTCAKELLRLRIEEMQGGGDFALINMMIQQINETNMDLMMLAQQQEDTLTDFVNEISNASDALMVVDMNLTTTETDLTSLVDDVITPTTNTISENTMEIVELQALIDQQKIIADLFYTNPAEILLNMDSVEQQEWQFCVPAGATFEYHMALADFAGLDSNEMELGENTFVQNVSLVELVFNTMTIMEDQVPVAKSNQTDGQRGHQHTLFYKHHNTDMFEKKYSLVIEQEFSGTLLGETPAKINPNNLQISIRVYGEGYGENLFSTTPLTCV